MGNILPKKSKQTKIILGGFDSTGKTTILYQMKLGYNVNCIHTVGFNLETI